MGSFHFLAPSVGAVNWNQPITFRVPDVLARFRVPTRHRPRLVRQAPASTNRHPAFALPGHRFALVRASSAGNATPTVVRRQLRAMRARAMPRRLALCRATDDTIVTPFNSAP
jgi:hypothetical protein